MTATPARIGFVTEPFRRAIAETPAAANRHGAMARESADPVDSYFATVADAQLHADDRQALLSPDRRRFSVAIFDVELALELLDAEEVLTARLIDPERGLDRSMIITEVVIDAEGHSAEIKLWG